MERELERGLKRDLRFGNRTTTFPAKFRFDSFFCRFHPPTKVISSQIVSISSDQETRKGRKVGVGLNSSDFNGHYIEKER